MSYKAMLEVWGLFIVVGIFRFGGFCWVFFFRAAGSPWAQCDNNRQV